MVGWMVESTLNVLYAESNPYRSALPIRESCSTIIQSAPVASGLEMVKNRRCVKQEGLGLLILAIYSLPLAEKEVDNSRRRKVKIIRFIASFLILFELFLIVTISVRTMVFMGSNSC